MSMTAQNKRLKDLVKARKTRRDIQERKKEIVKQFRENFENRFGEIFAEIGDKMVMMAMGYSVIIARKWEYSEKTRENHRSGAWYIVEDQNEALQLMQGLDEGEDDSYYRIVLQKPNVEMLKYIADQLMGRASQNIKLDHKSTQLSDILEQIRGNNKGVVGERNVKTIMESDNQTLQEPIQVEQEFTTADYEKIQKNQSRIVGFN